MWSHEHDSNFLRKQEEGSRVWEDPQVVVRWMRELPFLSSVQTDFVSLPAARLRCLYKVSTQHFVLYRQNIHDTPLPFPGIVSRNTIQGSKASCLKTGLEITILASRLFLWVMVE